MSPPDRIGRYEVLEQIGRGGNAVVFRARQVDLNREVALKQLAAFHVGDPEALGRFLRESRVTAQLSHPYIVTVHEFFEHDGVPFIAMEYFRRGSLRPLVGRTTHPQSLGVLECVLAALARAGERGVVHRDLKPENLMITESGGVKVADFGIAKALGELGATFATATGRTLGTPAYMSPEQAMGRELGPPTDLYATGVIAYELLAGEVPFQSVDTPMAILHQHVSSPPPPLLSRRPDLDPGLVAWVERMLAKAPGDRPPDAAAAWDELEEIAIRILGPRWRREALLREERPPEGAPAPEPTPEPEPPPPAGATTMPPTPTAEPETPAPPEPTEPAEPTAAPAARPRRRRVAFALAGLGVVAAVAVALVLALGGDGDGAPAEAAITTPPATTTAPVAPGSTRLTEEEYRAQANAVCADLPDFAELFGAVDTPAQLRSVIQLALESSIRPALGRLAALEPPLSLEQHHLAVLALGREEERVLAGLARRLQGLGTEAARSAAVQAAGDLERISQQANPRYRALGLPGCVQEEPRGRTAPSDGAAPLSLTAPR